MNECGVRRQALIAADNDDLTIVAQTRATDRAVVELLATCRPSQRAFFNLKARSSSTDPHERAVAHLLWFRGGCGSVFE